MISFIIIIVIPFILNLLLFRFVSRYKRLDSKYSWESEWEVVPAHTTLGHILYSLLIALGSYLGTLIIVLFYGMTQVHYYDEHPMRTGADTIVQSIKDLFNTKIG